MTSLSRIALIAAALGASTASADAATGWISGSVQLWNANGNYCPTTNSCVGSRYPQSQFHTWQALANAHVNVYDTAGTFIGQGGTASNGTFTVSWTAPVKPTQIVVRFFASQKDYRFHLADPSGGWYNWFTPALTVGASSPTSPQAVGGWLLGSSTVPDPYANAYWAAEREWRDVFNLVGVLQANFTNVEIRGFADNMPGYRGSCPTSCAAGEDKQVQLDANAAFNPQARVMHELGHIASYVTHPWKRTGNYNWPNTSGTDGWNQGSSEWSVAGFEEAFATHYGSIAFWASDAVTPTTCNSAASCFGSTGLPKTNADLEASSFPHAADNCDKTASAPELRRPISHMRFLWDVFDNHNDADGDSYSADLGDFWKHLHNLAWYAEGTGANQIDEPWNSTRTSVTELDGRGSLSYAFNYGANVANISVLRVDNCGPL